MNTSSPPPSRVTIHMAASLDGFIARKDGRVDWLETSDEFVGSDTMDPGLIEAFLKTIDEARGFGVGVRRQTHFCPHESRVAADSGYRRALLRRSVSVQREEACTRCGLSEKLRGPKGRPSSAQGNALGMKDWIRTDGRPEGPR